MAKRLEDLHRKMNENQKNMDYQVREAELRGELKAIKQDAGRRGGNFYVDLMGYMADGMAKVIKELNSIGND